MLDFIYPQNLFLSVSVESGSVNVNLGYATDQFRW
jgi:hypothetical protein